MHRRGWRLSDRSPANPVGEPLTVPAAGPPRPQLPEPTDLAARPHRRLRAAGSSPEMFWSRDVPLIDELCSKVSATAMFAHLEEFAKRVKLSGTPEELESFHYLQGQLDEMGFSTALIR